MTGIFIFGPNEFWCNFLICVQILYIYPRYLLFLTVLKSYFRMPLQGTLKLDSIVKVIICHKNLAAMLTVNTHRQRMWYLFRLKYKYLFCVPFF
jgi:hypothetical protein